MAVPWRNRARRAVETRFRDGLRANGDSRPHYIVCGQDALAYHLVTALGPASVRVTVITPPGRRPHTVTPDISAIRGIRLIKAERIDEDTLRAAGLETAAGLALMHQDDVGNIHAALTAHELAPGVRIVMRMFNTGLGYGVKRLLGDCEVLSDAAMAAPTFVAAALGELAPTHFHHLGRTLFVARREDVRPEQVICALADTSDPLDARMLPADAASADVVIAEATGEPAADVAAARRITRVPTLPRPTTTTCPSRCVRVRPSLSARRALTMPSTTAAVISGISARPETVSTICMSWTSSPLSRSTSAPVITVSSVEYITCHALRCSSASAWNSR